ncbi:vitellogenin-3-like [Zeugodacus cucurbitae]|uniref:vitellogenin-3-like n=1 Tax=Zeugodacus cucurbitae TaxID=28588 RepID=UPI0023D96ED1|nr:vitellogenin-3-like [Zeugodacus cucurbitae]
MGDLTKVVKRTQSRLRINSSLLHAQSLTSDTVRKSIQTNINPTKKIAMRILIISLWCLVQTSAAQEATPFDYLQSAQQIAEGLIASAPGPLRPDYFFRVVQNLVKGLPSQKANALTNAICAAVIASGRNQTPDRYAPRLEDIKFQLRTPCYKREYPVEDPSGLVLDPAFDINKRTVLFATGWTTTVNNERHDSLSKAYNCRGDTNYLALDIGDYINTLYSWSAQNTDVLGKYVAEDIQRLSEFIDVSKLHLMGHSLGAQIMGSAARHYRLLTGQNLPYVTGLDPAFPCFNEGETLTTISASDADFVDIIHTNIGVNGQYAAYGHVDFYVGGKFPIQNACITQLCSHEIVWEYYTESVYPNNELNFLARRCNSLFSLQEGRCEGLESPMGYAVPRDISGRYMLDANSKKPYGKNATSDYTDPDTSPCGACARIFNE